MRKATKLAERYPKDISCEDLVQEMIHMTLVRNASFGSIQLGELELLNAEYKLVRIFSNLSVSLRIFLTEPGTVVFAV